MATGLPRRLYRSRTDRMLSGVSAGLAAYFDIDPVLVRLIWVVGAVFTGGLLALAYIVLWIIVPEADRADAQSGVAHDNVSEPAGEAPPAASDAPELGGESLEATTPTGEEETKVVSTAGPEPMPAPERVRGELLTPSEAEEVKRRRTITAGVILLALGLLFLATNLGLFRWFNWGLYWPLLLVVLGALLIWNRSRSGA
jgi:phage shock protein C